MPEVALRPFAAHGGSDLAIRFAVERLPDGFDFTFTLEHPAGVVLPALAPEPARRRRDELWRHTCLEFFAAPAGSGAYLEFNLAPSGDWNLYRFDGYRAGMSPLEGDIWVDARREGTQYTGAVRGTALPAFLGRGPVAVGPAAVVEYADGVCAYWALAHTGVKPDFHRRDAFTLTLTPQGSA